MNYVIKSLTILVMLALGTNPSFAKAPVWKVSKGGDYVYLGGTVHVLSQKDYPLPKAFDQAYKNSDDVVFETDIQAFSVPEVQEQVLGAMSYQDHRGLSSVLDRETYQAFDALLTSRGIPIAVFDKFTPAGAMLALTQFELQKLGVNENDGVDKYFSGRAAGDQKESLYLETFEQQLGFIQSMNELEPNLVIKSGINDINKLESMWSELLLAWRTGDLEKLEEIGIDEMKRDFPSMYQTMLLDRNNDWVNKIKSMILTEDKEFILVGALHMAGDDGLIKRLKADGYSVSQLD